MRTGQLITCLLTWLRESKLTLMVDAPCATMDAGGVQQSVVGVVDV